MILLSSTSLSPQLKEQYDALLEEAKQEKFLYGIPLDPKLKRCVLVQDGTVVGACEIETSEQEDVTYFRTNRPYTLKAHRGKGLMFEALSHLYKGHRPAMAWIDDDNATSIALFTRLEFVKERALHYKNKDGHFYFLK